jgi:hypothetical protein
MRPTFALAATLLGLAAVAQPGAGAAPGDTYQTALFRWRAADTPGFADWEVVGAVRTPAGHLALDPASAQAGSDAAGAYQGRNFYNGGAYMVGEATGPLRPTGFGFTQAVVSWDADTPPGTWIEVLARAQRGGRLTKYYNLGVWAADASTIGRHSVKDQRDGDGTVTVDSLVVSDTQPAADAIQLKVRLFTTKADAVPSLRLAAAAVSTPPRRPAQTSPGDPARWNKVLDVPACSQGAYTDGGERWCSPTSTSMVLGFWGHEPGPCEPRVRAAAAGVYDWVYDGYGNWPFNAAYAGVSGHDLDSYVTRFTGLAQAEPWIAAGVPVVISYAWKEGALTGAPVRSSKGHLGVLVGFDAQGNPVMNDPAAGDGQVRRTYPRGELEAVWLEHSGGTAYLIYPSSLAVTWG